MAITNKKPTKKDAPAPRRRKADPKLANGIVHIHASYNNTIVTVTDEQGNVLTWASGGSIGFKGSKKKQAFTAQKATEAAITKAVALGVKFVKVQVKGAGNGRDSAVRAVYQNGLVIKELWDVTPLPHNGCRPQKRARK
jgi:small subunit ribosomal protein S11